jgi:dTDP-4-amino-4,6-dideoxygalactose transaminase
VFWLYSILVDEQVFGCSRDALIEALDQRQIEARPLFPPVHMQPIYLDERRLPVAERISASGLSLPSAASLTETEIARVVEALAGIGRARTVVRSQ